LRGRSLRVPPEIRAELLEHARKEAPNEACGLVVLRDGEAVRYERGRNAEPSPYRFRLEIAPEIWFLEDDGYELAVFHSHGASPPRPSRTDVEHAGLWQDRPYLILRADTGELAAWRIDGDSVVETVVE
jgi:proteasome lid subunit RPN8/RPN11